MEQHISFLVKALANAYDKQANAALKPYGLAATQFKVLLFLLNNEEGVRQVDIEQCFRMTNPTVTGIVSGLEKKGFVTREPNPADARSNMIVPTQMAHDLKPELFPLAKELDSWVLSGVEDDEAQLAIRILAKALNSL